MADSRTPVRRSPLAHRAPIEAVAGSLRMAESPFIGKFILRAEAREVVVPLRIALGLGLPTEPLSSATVMETALLWLGPDEWMMCTAPDKAADRSRTARDALAGVRYQLVDVSDYYTVIELAGAETRLLMAKLTTLDVHERAFRPGMVAGTLFGRAHAVLWQIRAEAEASSDTFRLFVRWSMADYLWCLLADAGREWGMPEQITVKGETLTID